MKLGTEIDAEPGKEFFVSMLTRDINLEDAILDLLDNSIDGAMRSSGVSLGEEADFTGFESTIELSEDSFVIKDNCGGIPEERFHYAFKHGRPSTNPDRSIPTVGVYGIGMKRSIYKLGREAKVSTKSGDLQATIPFTDSWMQSNDWKLPILPLSEEIEKDGTVVRVTSLRQEVSETFRVANAPFEESLRKLISQHYAFLIKKGFSVSVNGKIVEASPIDVRIATNLEDKGSIRPYLWEKTIGDVNVFLALSFHKPQPNQDEINDVATQDDWHWSQDQAGWTVVCNHRVVAYCDTSYLTGWGDKPVPKFHTQFNGIRGLVVFESNDSSQLPTNTTKRGIDLNSRVYIEVKQVMKEALKHFTDSTNKWKGSEDEFRNLITSASHKSADLDELRTAARVTVKSTASSKGGKIYKPQIPVPSTSKGKEPWVRYQRPKHEIDAVGRYFFGEDECIPSKIGAACFDKIRSEFTSEG